MSRAILVAVIVLVISLSVAPITLGQDFTPTLQQVYVKIYNEVVNTGTAPVALSRTGLTEFNYPLEDPTQRIVRVEAWFNGVNVSYAVYGGDEPYIRFIAPSSWTNLTPGTRAEAWVVYLVEVDTLSRFKGIIDFSNAYITGNTSRLEEESQPIALNSTLKQYVSATSGWNYTNPLLQLLVRYISSTADSDKPVDLVRAVVEYVDINIVYSIRMPPREPWETLLFMEGDCDDQSNLLVTVLRGLGIPSYQEYGMVYLSSDFRLESVENNGMLNITMIGGGGHAWAVAFLPPWGWVRIDTVFGVKGNWLSHIVSIPYYNYPTVVMGRSRGEASQVEWLSFDKQIAMAKLKYVILYEVSVVEQF
ncbi:hypothetical protein TCELL_0821 [Thermogladius calderae 1633]|uniref:Transglutaminase-like domain-containing protein n=1 Tax=Thermogladius calderae (strain DSM 22663 / VKM B-2946 / 1633) TaxID=1184251 RepID=I3TEQ7_THEC1|nr:transglutaminase-like domain-containing protein [Thermogladius calderae]AFK51245.1 hypothetical protein TCELL_0821 [Thermogladius calderae 1633]